MTITLHARELRSMSARDLEDFEYRERRGRRLRVEFLDPCARGEKLSDVGRIVDCPLCAGNGTIFVAGAGRVRCAECWGGGSVAVVGIGGAGHAQEDRELFQKIRGER